MDTISNIDYGCRRRYELEFRALIREKKNIFIKKTTKYFNVFQFFKIPFLT